MDLIPIPGDRGVRLVRAPATEREMSPALAPDRTERMANDTFNESGGEAERGLEQEDAEVADQDQVDTEQDSGAPDKTISFIA